MSAQVADTFKEHESAFRELVAEHVDLDGHRLVLAAWFQPDRDPGHLFLLEIVDGFGGNDIDPERELFEMSQRHPHGFIVDKGVALHQVFSNPVECAVAIKERWAGMQEILSAKAKGLYQVLHADIRPEDDATLKGLL